MARRVEGWVRAKRFAPGSRLPPERELAIRLGASRNVVREAFRILETRGVVEVRQGVGTFVAEGAPDGPVTIPVQLRLEASRLPAEEILAARRAVECAVVEVAARARDEFDLDEMREALHSTAAAYDADDRDRFVQVDLAFHELLGQATHNSLLRDVQAELTRATAAIRGIASESRDAMRAALRFHSELLDALERRDAEAARAVMLLHVLDAGERVLGALGGDAPSPPTPRTKKGVKR
jgi:GntR family transcriptional repressor for pyruvate dehydrogenase complex